MHTTKYNNLKMESPLMFAEISKAMAMESKKKDKVGQQ